MLFKELKHHCYLTAEALAELLAAEEPDWIPVCESEHSPPAYAEYLTESGGLLCSGCTFCRECESELVYTECANPECVLYLKPARAKDEK